MTQEDPKIRIARRVAQELRDGDVVNLGIGLPTQVANYIPDGIHITLQSENGFVGMGLPPDEADWDRNITNAGGQPASILPDGAFFDSATSFGIIRGGHVDVTVLGALEVDQNGDYASWMIPGKLVPGMGGAMDLVVGAKKVIVAMLHTNRGQAKILKKCTLPLTAVKQVNMIVTELGVMRVVPQGLVLAELAAGVSVEQVKAATEAELIISQDLDAA